MGESEKQKRSKETLQKQKIFKIKLIFHLIAILLLLGIGMYFGAKIAVSMYRFAWQLQEFLIGLTVVIIVLVFFAVLAGIIAYKINKKSKEKE